jgi:sec-independent protein translocase protein TatA
VEAHPPTDTHPYRKKGTAVNLGPTELIIILAIVLLLFGSKKLPSLARSLGKSSKEFKKGMTEGASEDEDSDVKA